MRESTASNQADPLLAADPVLASANRSGAVFGPVMGLIALTVGCTALGAYVGRDLSGGVGLALFVAALGCIVGLQIAADRGHEQLATALLFGLGLSLGLASAPLLAEYAKSQPAVLWQAAGATSGFVAALGAYGYATRRDLSSLARGLFGGLLLLIAFGLVELFVAIPNGNLIYCIAGLIIFGGFTVIDFNRLRRADEQTAVSIAAAIYLDIFNVFLLFLGLFGGGSEDS